MKHPSVARKITEIEYRDRSLNIPAFLNTRFRQYDFDILVYVI